ncbi:MAG: hypothetical protein ACI9BK_003385, partial [Acidimicrobiales bacterium]
NAYGIQPQCASLTYLAAAADWEEAMKRPTKGLKALSNERRPEQD